MLTPKDIETKEFGKAKVGGYKPEEVDDFLDAIYSDYSRMLSEKEALTKKVIALNEKIEEYKSEQDKYKFSQINAQKSRDDVLADARKKADKLVFDAQDYAKKLIETAKQEAEHQQKVKSTLTAEVEDFKSKLLAIYENHVKLISEIPTIKTSDDIAKSETLGVLEAATSDVADVHTAESENDTVADDDVQAETDKSVDDILAGFDLDAGDTVLMTPVNVKLDHTEPEHEEEPSEEESDTEEEEPEEYTPKRSQRFAKSAEKEDEEDDDDEDEEDDEKDSVLKGLFDRGEKKSLFGKKKGGLFGKKHRDEDDDDDFDDDDDDEDDDYYDDDDDE